MRYFLFSFIGVKDGNREFGAKVRISESFPLAEEIEKSILEIGNYSKVAITGFDEFKSGEDCFSFIGADLKKKPSRFRIFQCVSEEPRKAKLGEWYEYDDGEFQRCDDNETRNEYKIFKEVMA